nr:VCBS repeat-containing protein [bacterium]
MRRGFCLVLVAILLVSIPVGTVFGQQKTGQRPGINNPYMSPKSWTMFQDDESGLFMHAPGQKTLTPISMWMDSSHNIHKQQVEDYTDFQFTNHSSDPNRIPLDAGRLNQSCDTVVRAYVRTGNTACLEILKSSKEHGLEIERLKDLYFDGEDNSCNMIDVTVGDFIPTIDDKNEYHDEIAVALFYKWDSYYFVTLALYDYQLKRICNLADMLFDPPSGECTDPRPRGFRIDKGDFDGDGLLDIVVVAYYVDACSTPRIRFMAFKYDPENYNSFTTIGSDIWYWRTGDYPAFDQFDAATGDFDQDGKDDLAIYDRSLAIYSFGDDNEFHRSHFMRLPYGGSNTHNPRLLSGLFYLDPDSGYALTRRQLALIYNSGVKSDAGLSMDIWDYHNGAIDFRAHYEITDGPQPYGTEVRYPNWDAIVGNLYVEDGDNANPEMEIQVSYLREVAEKENPYGPSRITRIPVVSYFRVDNSWTVKSIAKQEFGALPDSITDMNLSLVRYDRDGDALFLGAPVHVVYEDVLSLKMAMQEPPKHVDFLPLHQDMAGGVKWDEEWGIINVNAFPEFVSNFQYQEETSATTNDISTSTTTRGGSISPFVEKSWEVGFWKFNGAGTFQVKAEFQWEHVSEKEKWNSKYNNLERGIEFETNDDDILYGKFQLLDIWRYPVINYKDDAGHYVYIDVNLPGPLARFVNGGTDHDDYQPLHINHNLLSYPAWTENFPEDLGAFTLPDGTHKKEIMTGATPLWIDYTGNHFTHSIGWSDSAGAGSRKTTTDTFNFNEDLKIAYTGRAEVAGITDLRTQFGVEQNFHNEDTDVETVIGSTELRKSNGIQITMPDLPKPTGDWKFQFCPAVYMMRGGGIKAAFAMNFNKEKLGAQWMRYYGGRPDPAVGLPHRFYFTRGDSCEYLTWSVNESMDRMRMRGFFVYHSDSDEKRLYGGQSVPEGTKVDLAARIYNLCLNNTAGPFKVRFETIIVDTMVDMELPMDRTRIGETTIDSLAALEVKEARVTWNTAGFALRDATAAYRIYVVVDPDNQVPGEIHEWKDPDHPNVK